MTSRTVIGTVTSFSIKKRYGFVTPDGGGMQIFLHVSAIQRAGLKTLSPGQKIHYMVTDDDGEQNLVILGLAE